MHKLINQIDIHSEKKLLKTISLDDTEAGQKFSSNPEFPDQPFQIKLYPRHIFSCGASEI